MVPSFPLEMAPPEAIDVVGGRLMKDIRFAGQLADF